MIDLTDFSKFVAERLKEDVEFSNFCIVKAGNELNFTRDSLMIADAVLPYLVVMTFAEQHETDANNWTIQMQIGIEGSLNVSTDVLGIKYLPSMDEVRNIGTKAIERIRCLLLDFGIKDQETSVYDKSVEIEKYSIVPVEAGESNAENAVFITVDFMRVNQIG